MYLLMASLSNRSSEPLIHSFILAISIAPLQVLLRGASNYSTDYCIGVSCRSALATVGKGLALGPCWAARAGVKPTTHQLKVIDSTKAPLRPTPRPRTLSRCTQWMQA